MLELKELAQYLTDKLNDITITNQEDYKFLIYSELGKSVPDTICGVLKTNEPTITPINGIKNIRYNAVVELSVPAPTSNFNLINVENIIGKVIENQNGKEVEFSNGNGLITFTFSRAKDYKMDYAVGETVPISFGVNVNYTENMVTSATKVWQIRPLDVENAPFLTIPYLSESILLEKGGKTSNINDALFQQTLLTSQIKYYRFEIPYETNDTLCSMLQKDILTGDFGKKYELKYYDGVSFTEDDPFISAVSIYRTGDSHSTKPDTATFSITFSDVDNGQNTIKYYLALVDNPFDSSSDNTQYFDSQADQQKYFIGEVINDVFVPGELLSNGAEFDEIPAPNLNSLYLTNQVYINTRKYDVFDLINKNYAIIKATNGDYTYFFYYKVNSGDIGANGQVSYSLEMDTIQTYLFDPRLTIKGSFIQKAHLDRWIEYEVGGQTILQFNGKADSTLFEREEIREVAKRLVKRSKLKYYSDNSQNDDLINACNDIKCWCYLYLSEGSYNLNADGNLSRNATLKNAKVGYTKSAEASYFEHPRAILCCPIVDNDNDVKIYVEYEENNTIEDTWISSSAIEYLANANESFYSNLTSIKLSVKPPFDLNNIDKYNGARVENGIIKFTPKETGYLQTVPYQYGNLSTDVDDTMGISAIRVHQRISSENLDVYIGLFYVTNDYIDPVLFTTDIQLPPIAFPKSAIVGANKNKAFNPKLNSEDYKNLTLTIAGNSYQYPIDKLNSNKLIFEYFETLTADSTKGLLRYRSSDNNAVFNQAYSQSFNGFSYTNDFSIGFSVSAYSNYIANNKNAYLSFQNQQSQIKEQTALNTAQKLTNTIFNPQEAISNATSIAFDWVSTANNLYYKKVQFDLSIDNMKSAPEQVQNINGSAILNYMIAEFGIYAELYEGLDTELEMANDIMFRDGYNYNRFGEIEDFINIRHNFNYIKAILGNLSGLPISEEARRNFKQRFASGIRFWKKNNNGQFVIDYIKENYENKLV